jgi:hypothetical protein
MSRVRMLKKATLYPPYPRHAETCPLPGLFSARKNPQRTPEGTLPGFLGLRPRWRTFLSILFHSEIKIEPVLRT